MQSIKKRKYIIPLFIPELACPFQCVFCNQEKISGAQTIPSIEDIEQTIQKHLLTIDTNNSNVELAFFGGNFTGISLEEQKMYLQSVQKFLKPDLISSIRISTRPDYINEENLNMLKSFSVKTIELGAQSLYDDVLQKSGRGHKRSDVEKASRLITQMDFELGLQMMIGLPGDTKEKSIQTAKQIIKLGASNTRIYPTLVIRGTKLEELYKTGKYTPLSIDEAVNWTKDILPLFEKADVTVLRIGLHPSEGLLEGHELVAGPFHQSFKELVLTEIWKDRFTSFDFNYGIKNISILVNKNEINHAVGYNSKNKIFLQEHFDSVRIIADDNIKKGEFVVNYN